MEDEEELEDEDNVEVEKTKSIEPEWMVLIFKSKLYRQQHISYNQKEVYH